MIGAVMLAAALALAPLIGGGFGELAGGILQLLIFGGIAAHATSRRDGGSFVRVPGMAALAVFVAALLISTVFSESIYSSLKQVLMILACIGAYMLAAALCRDRKAADAVVWVVVLSALVVSALGIRNYAISTGGGAAFWRSVMGGGEHLRLFGTFINPGFFAGFLVISLPVTLGAYLAAPTARIAVLAGAAFVEQAAALLLTGAKFGVVPAAVSLLVMLVLGLGVVGGRELRRYAARLAVLALVVIPIIVVFSGPVRSRFEAAGEGGAQVHSTTFRIYTWKATLRMIEAKPLVGVGPGVFEIAYPRYTIAGPTRYAHQSYLQTASESGVIALGALLAALAAIAYRSLKAMRRSQIAPEGAAERPVLVGIIPQETWPVMNCAIFAALAGSATRNLVDSDWYVIGIALPFWALAGVLAARSGAASGTLALGRGARAAAVGACGLCVLLSASFGLGDYFAPADLEMSTSVSREVLTRRYELAARVSPLNPKYWRELGKLRAAPDRNTRELEIAARLSPTDAANYFALGAVSAASGRPDAAIRFYRTALKFNPNSTQTIYQLALALNHTGRLKESEAALARMLRVEHSPYELIKGVPELVDTNYAFAHAYFGTKYLAQGNFTLAAAHFDAAALRLERWRSNKQMLDVMRMTGRLSSDQERGLLRLLAQSYLGAAQAYSKLGKPDEASERRGKARRILAEL